MQPRNPRTVGSFPYDRQALDLVHPVLSQTSARQVQFKHKTRYAPVLSLGKRSSADAIWATLRACDLLCRIEYLSAADGRQTIRLVAIQIPTHLLATRLSSNVGVATGRKRARIADKRLTDSLHS
jgi:hypothetical protein